MNRQDIADLNQRLYGALVMLKQPENGTPCGVYSVDEVSPVTDTRENTLIPAVRLYGLNGSYSLDNLEYNHYASGYFRIPVEEALKLYNSSLGKLPSGYVSIRPLRQTRQGLRDDTLYKNNYTNMRASSLQGASHGYRLLSGRERYNPDEVIYYLSNTDPKNAFFQTEIPLTRDFAVMQNRELPDMCYITHKSSHVVGILQDGEIIMSRPYAFMRDSLDRQIAKSRSGEPLDDTLGEQHAA